MIEDSAVSGPSKNPKKRERPDIIEISSDEVDHEDRSTAKHRSKIIKAPTGSTPISSSRQATGVMQNKHERMKLEAERLARQRARGELAPKSVTVNDTKPGPSAPPQKIQSLPNYWNSTIKTTFNRWHPNSPHAIRIEDIIGPKHRIKMALVSSYVADLAWVHGLFDRGTRIMVIKHDAEPGTFKVNERDNMFLCHPPMHKTANGKMQHGCMHIKFFLIFYDDFCRVAIPTANAVDFDYEDIENSVWIQDFRRCSSVRDSNSKEQSANKPPFEKTFQNLLNLMGVPSAFRQPMEDYDFSPAAANLVVSVQGAHSSQSSYGQFGLTKELKALRLLSGRDTGRTVALECQGSSIGSYDMTWLKNFYCCASGSESDPSTMAMPPIEVLFPTLQTVKNSKTGLAGGGTLFCNKSTWEKPNYPTQIFGDAISKRAGVIMHVKMILGVFTPESSDQQIGSSKPVVAHKSETENKFVKKDDIGFLYIGSHNFTPAAWGKILTKSSSNQPLGIEISNWELGVVLPISSHSKLEEYVPWQRPTKKYGHDGRDTRIPWMQFTHGR